MELNNTNLFPPNLQPGLIPTPPTPELKPKMKRWKKVLLWIFGILALLVLVFFNIPRILTLLHPGDAVLQDDSDLRMVKVSTPDSQNGFFDLNSIDIKNDVYNPSQQEYSGNDFGLDYTNYANPPAWDQPLVDNVLTKSQAALTLFDQAASKPYFQIPDYADPANINANIKLYPMNSWLLVARLQAIKALSLAWHGNTDQGLEEAVKLNILGHNMIDSNATTIQVLVGIHMQSLGSQTILQILPYGTSSQAVLKEVANILSTNSNNITGYQDDFRGEYTAAINNFDELVLNNLDETIKSGIQSGSIDPNAAKLYKYGYYLKPNQTKNLLQGFYRNELQTVGKSCQLNSSGPAQNNSNSSINLFTENAIGELLFNTVTIDMGSLLTLECQTDFAANVAQTELALRQYQTENGSLPPTLDALVPQYLSAVPLDPFDHQPIRYSAAKKILYSVGLNKQDLGGSTGTDWTTMANPTFTIGF